MYLHTAKSVMALMSETSVFQEGVRCAPITFHAPLLLCHVCFQEVAVHRQVVCLLRINFFPPPPPDARSARKHRVWQPCDLQNELHLLPSVSFTRVVWFPASPRRASWRDDSAPHIIQPDCCWVFYMFLGSSRRSNTLFPSNAVSVLARDTKDCGASTWPSSTSRDLSSPAATCKSTRAR